MNIRQILSPILLASALAIATQAIAADVGVSVRIGQPGFYGRIDIGDYPVPQIIYTEPIVVRRAVVEYEPIFLHVPPGHAKRWRYYCGRYGACDRPVYFVDDGWYNEVYVPQYRERHGDRDWDRHDDRARRDDRGHGRKHDHDRRHGRD